MLAYKTKLEVVKGFLQLQLPEFFNGKKVEIIVLEVSDIINSEKQTDNLTVNQKETNDFQQFLMTAPTWTDNEYENYIENRKHFSQWTIK